MNDALNLIGIKSIHFPQQLFSNHSHSVLKEYQGFTDNPIPLLYMKLDKMFPNSKFILTTRDVDEWVVSMRWMFENKFVEWDLGNYPQKEMIFQQYGTYNFDETLFCRVYEQYIADVNNYFKHRSENLLVIDLTNTTDDEKWNLLTNFLDIEDFKYSTESFPRSNPSDDNIKHSKESVTISIIGHLSNFYKKVNRVFYSKKMRNIFKRIFNSGKRKDESYFIARLIAKKRLVNFLQIGSNNGVDNDPIHRFIMAGGWRGVLVEPIPHIYEQLKSNYAGVADLTFKNVAISDKPGRQIIYRLQQTSNFELPVWYQQLASFRKDVILKHRNEIPQIESLIVEESVECKTIMNLINETGLNKIDLIHIDTEGFDFEVIKLIPFSEITPSIIIYEHKHLTQNDKAASIDLLKKFNYHITETNEDIIAHQGI